MLRGVILALFAVAPALAQQPDQATLQRVISVLQQHRNEQADARALAEARAAQLAEEVQKLKAELDKAKQEKPKDD